MAYINAKDVTAIRNELKEKFPEFKFGVRKGSGSLSVDVTIKAGPVSMESLWPASSNHRPGHVQLNQYHLGNYGTHETFFTSIVEIIKTAPIRGEGFHKGSAYYDRSDAMTDYFDTSYYFHLQVGDWNRPYQLTTK